MPLSANIYDIYSLAKAKVEAINEGKGVIILVDMGSLTRFGERITLETGIPTKTLSMVSTPLVIDITRKVMQFDGALDAFPLEANFQINALLDTDVKIQSEKEKLMVMVSDILHFIDGNKAINVLDEVYKSIINQLQITDHMPLYVKSIFHSTCMLERAIRKEPLLYDFSEHDNAMIFKSVFDIIKQKIELVEDIYGVEITKDEIMYLSEIFYLES